MHATRIGGGSWNLSSSFVVAGPRDAAVEDEIARHDVASLVPKQLPARLTTLQEACLARVFEANPASCPAHSLIGHVLVHTELLPVPLTGPVYFVSHGAAKFPDAIAVLQGDNVTVDVTAETFIKNGVTSATIPNIPGVPFETAEITIPAGPHSEFTGNLPAKAKYSFCGRKLTTPTLFTAQNGLEIHQNTLAAARSNATALSENRQTFAIECVTLSV